MSCDELHILVWFRMSCPSDAGSLTLKHQVMGQRLETAATVSASAGQRIPKTLPSDERGWLRGFRGGWRFLFLAASSVMVLVDARGCGWQASFDCKSCGLLQYRIIPFLWFFSFPLSMWGWVMPYLRFSMCKSSRTSYFNFSGKGTDRVLIHTWVGRGFP